MDTLESRRPLAIARDNISVLNSSALLTRRVRDLQRRRQALLSRQEELRIQLPEWAVSPLKMVGLTADEVRGLASDVSSAENEAGLDDVDEALSELDQQAEELENLLLRTPASSLDELATVMDLLVDRFREIFVTDPNDVFYDHGEARLLALVLRIQDDLNSLVRRGQQEVG
jgi:hypothetical protein